ncbi:MAG TPA: cytochrome c oxidase assembly protein [Ktedonobacterales bacterium]
MTPSVALTWSWDPIMWLLILGLGGAYYAVIGPLRVRHAWGEPATPRQITYFVSGVVLLGVALVSPLDALGRNALFSAHMLQLMLLNTLIAPLLLLGLPDWVAQSVLRRWILLDEGGTLVLWAVAALVFNGVFLLWHVGPLYEAGLRDTAVHDLESVTILLTGALRWWPLLTPGQPRIRLAHPGQMLYILLESLPIDIFAIALIFVSHPLYATYAAAPRLWATFPPLLDQQVAGCIALIPGTFLDIILISAIFFAWFRRMEREQEADDERLAAIGKR